MGGLCLCVFVWSNQNLVICRTPSLFAVALKGCVFFSYVQLHYKQYIYEVTSQTQTRGTAISFLQVYLHTRYLQKKLDRD